MNKIENLLNDELGINPVETIRFPTGFCHSVYHVKTEVDEFVLRITKEEDKGYYDGCIKWLLDWEGLRFAPREADLFMFKYERYWGQRWNEFYDVYNKIHPHFEINETVMRFFQIRRRLNDVDEFVNNIVLDNESDEVIAEARQALIRECGLL